MTSDLVPLATALADLDDRELDALLVTVDECPQFAPGLLAWIEHLCDWEQNRRQGLDPSLQPPEVVMERNEDADCINAAMVMRDSFAQDDRAEAVTALLDAIVGVLTGREHRQ
jgi:hypothetical protein